jgi:hypothetical protein
MLLLGLINPMPHHFKAKERDGTTSDGRETAAKTSTGKKKNAPNQGPGAQVFMQILTSMCHAETLITPDDRGSAGLEATQW